MGQYRYDFSVVMAVYNVEEYLREAVDSLVQQTIGFDRIQLILVDDGSKDGSGAICDEYKERYPQNVIVIHKENGGVSSARNEGLKHATGRYLNFMDSDDKMSENTFMKVFQFFSEYEGQTDVAAIPMRFFEAAHGEHIQNDKFKIDKSVLDLYEHPYITNLSASASFIRAESAKEFDFDTNLTALEDAKFMLQILFKKMTLGLVKDATYWYRKRHAAQKSASQTATRRADWYLNSTSGFSLWALNKSKEIFGTIPQFVQYEVMYDLQWKILQEHIDESVLNQEEMLMYKEMIFNAISMIDDNVIFMQKNIYIEHKIHLLTQKYGKYPHMIFSPSSSNMDKNIVEYVDGEEIIRNQKIKSNDPYLCIGQTLLLPISSMKSTCDFIEIDKNDNTLFLEGFHTILGIEREKIQPCLIVNDQVVLCQKVDRKNGVTLCMDEEITSSVGFRASIPLVDKRTIIKLALLVDGILIQKSNIDFSRFFPISKTYGYAYALRYDRMITYRKSSIVITCDPSRAYLFKREFMLLKEIWKKNMLGGRKAVLGRIFYHLVKPFKRKELWIISDRIMNADDNGEALFSYIMKHKPKGVKAVFAISKNSSSYAQLKKIGKCVDAMSFHHKLLHLLCDVNISSQADFTTVNPFYGHHNALKDLLVHQRFVFLQHGITQNDLSDWLNRYSKNISGFITAANPEYQSIVGENYHYTEKEVWLTGFPRFDRLYHHEEKKITIMPTWRRYLMDDIVEKTGEWRVIEGFETQPYYEFYDSLLNSDRLLKTLEQYGYTLQFFPHPNIRTGINYFHHDPRVNFLTSEVLYRDVYATSELVITDYSSAVFDFAYLRKPVIYCQFDKEEFFGGKHTLSKGYFDYERDGFGEVTYDLEHTIDMILEYAANGCKLKDKYRERIDQFFAFNDQNNCQRVLEKILTLTDK